MSLRLNTGVMQYRESQNDVWKPMVIKTNLDWESLAEDYDATSDYEVGTYVLYNAELYRCTTAVPTGGEAWNAAHWIKVDFGSELNSLTEDVNELQEIAGDGALSGFTATNLTGAANELKNTLNQLESEIGIVVDGKSCALGASKGQYIILKNSTISGLSDGLYTASQNIPLGEQNVTSSMLTGPILGGGLNALSSIDKGTYSIYLYPTKYNGVARFFYSFVNKTTTKSITLNKVTAFEGDVSTSAVNFQLLPPNNVQVENVQFYSTNNTLLSTSSYVEFNITVS